MGSIRFNTYPPAPVAQGQDLLGALLDAHGPIIYLCMAGSCGRCRVTVESGGDLLSARTRAEENHTCGPDERLACQTRLARDGHVKVRQ